MSEEVAQVTTDDVSQVASLILGKQTAGRTEAAPAKVERENVNAEAEADEVDNGQQAETETEGAEDEAVTDGEEEAETETEAEEQPKYTVKVDGKEMEVTLDELRAGYMKDSDYRKKTASVAEERRATEAKMQEIADLAEKRSVYLKELEVLSELNNRQPVSQEQLDKLLQSNPAEYVRAKAANEQWAENQRVIRERISNVKAEMTEADKAEFANKAKQEAELLVQALPELATPEVKQKLAHSLLERGFTKEQIEQTVDHRMFVMAEEARRYREMIAGAKQKPVAKVPKVTQGKAASRDANDVKLSEVNKAKATAAKTGSVEDVARLMLMKQKHGVR